MPDHLQPNLDYNFIAQIAKSYSPLQYAIELVDLARLVHPVEDHSKKPKFELQQLLNQFLLQYYSGEHILKYKLFNQFMNRKNITGAFEIKVNESRADFLTINDHTSCYEIKTARDNLNKFEKQSNDYLQVFEFNHLVTVERHLDKAKALLPQSFGVWLFDKGKLKQIKKPSLNQELQPEIQLQQLTLQERRKYFTIPSGDIRTILQNYNAINVNKVFKIALKNRYASRWQFIVTHRADILPMDIQFFFNRNIYPANIYQIAS